MIATLEISNGLEVPCGTRAGEVASDFSFRVPDDEQTGKFFATRVQDDEQRRVRDVLAAIGEVWHCRKSEGVNPACQRLALSLERNWRSLRRDYYAYTTQGCRKGTEYYPPGDWRTVLNFSKVKSERVNLPFATLELWRELGELNQRKWKPAYDELLNIIRTGYGFPHGANGKPKVFKKFPGFEVWPVIDLVLGHPAGMSYSNLMNHTGDKYDTSLARHGRVKGNELRLPVLKTRTNLLFGQLVEFDDHDFNQKPMFQKKPMRPSGFMAIEVLTSNPALLAIKPNLWDFETQARLTLTEREFMWFIIAYLTTVGVRTDAVGTTLITERAKAVIKGEFKERLLRVVPNLKIYAGALPSRAAGSTKNVGNARAPYAGQFDGAPKGNFRTKALVEGFFNIVDNQTASLAGQMGKDRNHTPAQLYGQEKYAGELVRAIEAGNLSLERAAQIQFPFLTFHQWRALAHEAVQRIREATDHKLEGWEQLGFERVQWRASAESVNWFEPGEFAALPDVERSIIKRRMDADRSLTRTVRLSRGQVFDQLKRRGEVKPVPLYHIPELVGRENALNGGAKPLRVERGLFSFDCAEIEPDTLYFYARDQRGFLPNGAEYIGFVNPCHPQHLIACDESLRVVAICPRYERAHDDVSLKSALGAQNAYEAAAKVRLDLRHDDAARRNQEMKRHNAAILNGPAEVTAPEAVEEFDREARDRELREQEQFKQANQNLFL
jgi:hypothetical protein